MPVTHNTNEVNSMIGVADGSRFGPMLGISGWWIRDVTAARSWLFVLTKLATSGIVAMYWDAFLTWR